MVGLRAEWTLNHKCTNHTTHLTGQDQHPVYTLVPYSGKLSREKSFVIWWKIWFSRRKLSQIARFRCAKGRHGSNFLYSHKTAKFAKVSPPPPPPPPPRKFSAIRYIRPVCTHDHSPFREGREGGRVCWHVWHTFSPGGPCLPGSPVGPSGPWAPRGPWEGRAGGRERTEGAEERVRGGER